MPHGQGIRCVGFVTDDGYIHCTREEHAGQLEPSSAAVPTFAHINRDDCRCGIPHGSYGSPALRNTARPQRRIVHRRSWQIKAPDGTLLARHWRHDYSDGSKEYPWQLPDGTWTKPSVGTAAVMYGAETVPAADASWAVVIVEGEKAADALRGFSIGKAVVMASVCGANTPVTAAALEVCRGRRVYLWPDHDEPGRAHMHQIGGALRGIASDIRLIRWGERDRDDAADFVERGGTHAHLVELVRTAEALAPNETNSVVEPVVAVVPARPNAPRDDWPEPPGPDVFRSFAGDVVDAVTQSSEADRIAVLANLLAAFGAAVGSGPHVMVSADRHTARVFHALVGDSAVARKGTSWSPIRTLFEQSDPELRVVNGLVSGEGVIYHLRDADGDDPGVTDKRLLVSEPEMARVLRATTRQGNTLSSVLREAWDGGKLSTLTKHSPNVATRPHLVVIAHITREELRRELADTEIANGFGNRFLWLAVRRPKLVPEPLPFSGETVDHLSRLLGERLNRARRIGAVHRTAEAASLWREVYGDLTAAKHGLAGALTARGDAQVVRLSLIYALLDGSDEITAEHLQAALELWGYAERSALHVFGMTVGDPIADSLLATIRSGPRDRTQLHEALGRHVTAARITEALDRMLADGVLKRESLETGGRPKEMWRLAT